MRIPLDALFTTLERRDRLSDREKEALSGLDWNTAAIQASSEIVMEHSHPTKSCLLLEGLAAGCLSTAAGDRQITGVYVPGELVDLHGLLLKQLDHSVVALTDCKVAYVSHFELGKLWETMPHLARALMTLIAVDAAIQRNRILMLGRKRADSRLANLLCELYLRLEVVGMAAKHRFRFQVTQAEVADMLGLSTVHTNRILMDLKASGILEWQGSTVCIADWIELCRVGEFDPVYLNLVCEAR